MRHVIVVLLAVLVLCGIGQRKIYAITIPDGTQNSYSYVMYNNTNGLPTSDVNAVLQTSEGFVWIGSYAGLIQYDGNHFVRFDSTTGVSSVVTLFEDSQKRLWIGTNDSGLFLLQGDEFVRYDQEEGLRASSVRSIKEDEEGNIIVATTMGISYVDADGVMHPFDDERINTEYIWELKTDKDGVIWGITMAGKIFSMSHLKITSVIDEEIFGYGIINTIYPDPVNEDYMYLGMQESTVLHAKVSPEGLEDVEIMTSPEMGSVRCIRKVGEVLWLCSNNGIGIVRDGRFLLIDNLPMDNSVETMMVDYEGNMWFTSSRQGLLKIVRNRFTDIFEVAGLAPLVVNSTYFKDGLLYIGSDTGLVILDEQYRAVGNDLTKLLEGVRIRSIRPDSKGHLWFGTNSDNGLIDYDPGKETWIRYNPSNGLAAERARVMMELSDGRIAVATNAGVNVIADGKVTETYNGDQGINNLEILCLEEGPDGEIFAGSDGDGIYVIKDGKVSNYGREDGLGSEVILRIRKDPVDTGLYWVITSNSICYMKDGSFTRVNRFPYANNFDMVFDRYGRIWVLSSNGLYVLKREEMFTEGEMQYLLYDITSGLPCAPTANSYSCLTDDGRLYIAATNGVSSVDIQDTDSDNDGIRLSVPFVLADDVYIPVIDGQVTIPAQCKRLNIHAYAFSYSLNNPYLHYHLEGFEDDVTEVSRHDIEPVTYTNLKGGTYKFHFSILNTLTGLDENEMTVTLVKQLTAYEQGWFWLVIGIVGLALIAAVVAFYYHRKNTKLMKQHQEREKLIDEMTSVFASCVDLKDAYTNGHSHRVASYSAKLARKLGKSEDEVRKIYRIALLHDIGKIAIPDSILNKQAKLTDEEYAVMKSHPKRGYDILKDVTIDPDLAIGAGYHHERLDGKGYPFGLTGEKIPEFAQIISVADTFDAMYSTRPYRKQLDLSVVTDELKRCAGTQLNGDVVNALLALVEEGNFLDPTAK